MNDYFYSLSFLMPDWYSQWVNAKDHEEGRWVMCLFIDKENLSNEENQ